LERERRAAAGKWDKPMPKLGMFVVQDKVEPTYKNRTPQARGGLRSTDMERKRDEIGEGEARNGTRTTFPGKKKCKKRTSTR